MIESAEHDISTRMPDTFGPEATLHPPENTDAPAVAVEVSGLSFYYGATRALTNISLQMMAREVTAFIGPSGCGKSTFLRCLNRMNDVLPDVRLEGTVLVEGENIYRDGIRLEDLRKKVGMVFQKSNPFPMSLFENVAFGPKVAGVRDRNRLEEIVEQALRKADLWREVKDRLKDSSLELSGGQQQRLCIARALANNPDIVLMDEPASALDPISTAKIEETIIELKKDYTIVIVTHNLQQAARISDRTAFFYQGALVEYDRTEVIFQTPANKQTEDYITGRFG